jgi:hypothetical protein
VGGLALLTARGGNDEQQATRAPNSRSQQAIAAPAVGDFGDLDQPENLSALRAALAAGAASRPAAAAPSSPQSAADATSSERSAATAGAAGAATSQLACSQHLPEGARVVARATGTMDGRAVTVVLTQLADGSRSYDAVFEDPCGVRPLGNG